MGLKLGSRIFYFIHLQNEEDYERGVCVQTSVPFLVSYNRFDYRFSQKNYRFPPKICSFPE